MTPAAWPREQRAQSRLLHIDPARGTLNDVHVEDLRTILRRGDLLIVNDAATLPASMPGMTPRGPVEVRLAGQVVPVLGQAPSETNWHAVLFGAGNWRRRTEDRPPPPVLDRGETIDIAPGLHALVVDVSPVSPRLVELQFDRAGAGLWSALYRAGSPVQYSYLCGPLALWHVQTPYAARPWAVEMPSAGWSFDARLLRALRQHQVGIAPVTHAAGLSSTGDPAVDAVLPLPESYDIPVETIHEIERTRAQGGRIVAVGTTAVRALEGCAATHGGRLRAGLGITQLRIGPGFVPQVVDGLLTGMHEPGTSHFALLRAFVPEGLLDAASRHADAAGYLAHEFGDACLALAS